MADYGRAIAKAGAVVMVAGLWAVPANALVTAAMCKMVNKHLTNGHCCPADQTWVTQNGVPQCAAVATGFGISIGIEDPRNPFKTTPCKALHTC